MSSIKNENINIYKIIQSKKELEKINGNDIIKEAISLMPIDEDNLQIEKRKILETLNNIKEKVLQEYLNSISNKKIKEIKEELSNHIDKYNKSMINIIMKSKIELKETKKENNYLKEEIKNLNIKIIKHQDYTKDLLEQLNEYQNTLSNLENNYSSLITQKKIFDEITKDYPDKNPTEVINQIKIVKKGNLMMLESFAQMSKEFEEMKDSIKNMDIKYKKKINYLTDENDQILSDKKDDKEKYLKKINELKNRIQFNEDKIKENDFLRNTLYYIYNIIFDKLNLVKDIVINEKYKGLTEKDFNPNVLYDPELISYIELMVERMVPDSYDKMFRECIGYLNMIIRNYLPDKEKLRFKPVEIFREITNFIDIKMKLIEEYKNMIKHNKININNLELKYNKLNDKYKNLSKEYESYKILIEKNIEKNNKEYINEKNDKIKKNKNRNKNKFLLGFNNTKINNNNKISNKKSIILKDYKFNFDIEPNNNKKNFKYFSPDKKNKVLSAFKGNSIYNRYYSNIKDKNKRNIKNNNEFNSFDNRIINSIKRKNKIEKNINEDKLLKENGNQENLNNLNKINDLIDETNRLFLYRPRMTSFQKNFHTINSENKLFLEKPEINTNLNNKKYENNLIKTFEGKIMKKIDNLISSSDMN